METCNYHQGLLDTIVKSNEQQNEVIHRIEIMILEINKALIGDLGGKQGLIDEVKMVTLLMEGKINLLETWKNEKDLVLKKLVWRLFGFTGGVVFTAAISVIAIAKWMIN